MVTNCGQMRWYTYLPILDIFSTHNTTKAPINYPLQNLFFKKLEKASTHKSAKTHAGKVFVTCDLDLDLWPFDTKINGFPRLNCGTFLC